MYDEFYTCIVQVFKSYLVTDGYTRVYIISDTIDLQESYSKTFKLKN